MNLATTIYNKSPARVGLAILAALAAGVCYTILIPLIISFLATEDMKVEIADPWIQSILLMDLTNAQNTLAFLMVCLFAWVFRSVSQVLLVNVATRLRKDLRLSLYQRVSQACPEYMTGIDSQQTLDEINDHLDKVKMGSTALPNLLINVIALVGMLWFLWLLSAKLFLLVMVCVVIGILCWEIPMRLGMNIYFKSIDAQNVLVKATEQFFRNAKELIRDKDKCQQYIADELEVHEQFIAENDCKANRILMSTHSFTDLISFVVVGVLCFIFSAFHQLSFDELVSAIIIVLFVNAPMNVLLSAIPQTVMSSQSYQTYLQLLENFKSKGE